MATSTIKNNYQSTQFADLTSQLPSGITGHNNHGLEISRVGNVVEISLSIKETGGNNSVTLSNILPDWANPITAKYPNRKNGTVILSDGSARGISSVNYTSRTLIIYFGDTKYAIGTIIYVID